MHPFEIREKRFRLQQMIAKLEEGDGRRPALEKEVTGLREICQHPNFDEAPEKGWRCRDCDLTRPPEEQPEPEADEPGAHEAAATGSASA